MSVPTPEMLKAYLAASTPGEWLDKVMLDALGEGLTSQEAKDLVASAREQAAREADEFLSTEVDPSEVIATIVVFARPGEDETGAAGGIFRVAPSAMALLELAANECDALDEVVVSHRYASGEEITLSRAWPFDLSGAVDLLTPGSAPLVEDTPSASAFEQHFKSFE